jgi:hypothetical protein
MIVKMLTHAHDDIHMMVLALLRRQWSLSGREGFEFLSSSCRACSAGFDAFWGSKTPIFYYAGGGEMEV